VTLVGVILADVGLSLPDFRASERTFQILTQVAGRAGRGSLPGRVIVQTLAPEHYAVAYAIAQDFEGFYQRELAARARFRYPPCGRLASLRLTGRDADSVKRAARELAQAARRLVNRKAFSGRVEVRGPAPAPLSRLAGKTRWLLLVKADTHENMGQFLAALLPVAREPAWPRGVELDLDRDPVFIM
jgi:primosomal protein N' (replication factor Y) (superfamily II helicase)